MSLHFFTELSISDAKHNQKLNGSSNDEVESQNKLLFGKKKT